jgi:hypothetical protein
VLLGALPRPFVLGDPRFKRAFEALGSKPRSQLRYISPRTRYFALLTAFRTAIAFSIRAVRVPDCFALSTICRRMSASLASATLARSRRDGRALSSSSVFCSSPQLRCLSVGAPHRDDPHKPLRYVNTICRTSPALGEALYARHLELLKAREAGADVEAERKWPNSPRRRRAPGQ